MNAPTAFRQQLLAAIPRLRRYARSLVFDEQGAADLVQTALLKALSHWQQFDRRREMIVWLVGIAHNAHRDDRRRQSRVDVVDPDEAALKADGRHPAAGHDIGLRLDLLAALRSLPDEQRQVLLLVGVEQFSYAECADALGIPIGTVMSRLSRGRVALRSLLEGGAPVPGPVLRRVV